MTDTRTLERGLFDAPDGGVAWESLQALKRRARTDQEARRALGRYVLEGPIPHVRGFAAAALASDRIPKDREDAKVFESGLRHADEVGYWSIPGLLCAAGCEAYPVLVDLVRDEARPLDHRAHAIQCLALHSGQTFDRGLPDDPGLWRPEHLRIEEVLTWKEAGFPRGACPEVPPRDPALDQPRTQLERAVARLDQLLARSRRNGPSPSQLFTPSPPDALALVDAHWNLPAVYREFLARFSPLRVEVRRTRLFGVSEVLAAQEGYGWDPVRQQPIPKWPSDLLVVASRDADPFVLSLDGSEDPPVLTASHGEATWTFRRVAPSFLAWLEALGRPQDTRRARRG